MNDDPYRAPNPQQDHRSLFRRLSPMQIAILILLAAFAAIWWISGSVFWGVWMFLAFAVANLVGRLSGGNAGPSKDN